MIDKEWEALVQLATVREPKLGTKLSALRAIKKSQVNIQVGHPDPGVREEALTVTKVYKDILDSCIKAVWGEALGIRIEEAKAGEPSGSQNGSALRAEPATPPLPSQASSAGGVDKYMSGMVQEIRREIQAEFEAKAQADQSKQDPKKLEEELLAKLTESARRAQIEEKLVLVEGGAHLLKEVWEIWSRVIASARGGLEEDITDLIQEADSRVHSLSMILARLTSAPKKDGKG